MNLARTLVTVFFCLSISASYSQEEVAPKKGMFSFSISLSDYNFVSKKNDFKTDNTSFGFQVSYWRHLIPHIDLSANLGGDFSNFPATFVKGDSIGQGSFSTHLDGLIHFKAFRNDAPVNPFLTAGIGAGYFGKQAALYAPLGAGLAFHFSAGGVIIVQGQMRKALSSGITRDFMFYSIGFAQDIPGRRAKKHESHKDEVVKSSLYSGSEKNKHSRAGKVKKSSAEKETAKGLSQPATETIIPKNEVPKSQPAEVVKENTASPLPDTDGDGVADKDDKCPNVKGSAENQGCPFPVVEGAKILNISTDSATYSISFDFDQSMLQTGAFAVLKRIVDILKSDKTLTVEIAGHADSQGTELKNMQVSADRAKVTRDYLISYNIATSRIKSSYYGASRPLDKVQQWRNRRVEITIIKK